MLDNIQAALFVISIQETAQVEYFYGTRIGTQERHHVDVMKEFMKTIVVGVCIGTKGEVRVCSQYVCLLCN